MKIRDARKRRCLRGKKKLLGTKDKPRLCVYKSLKNMYAQLIDDIAGKTILSASTLDKDIAKQLKNKDNIAAARALGELLAKKAIKANIRHIKFDKSGYLYHGRVKELAEACRKQGMQF